MKTRHWVFALVLVLAAFSGIYISTQVRAADDNKKKPVEFTLKNTDGKDVKIADYRGKVVVLDVWATWCGYCVREIPELMKLQKEADDNKWNLQIIGLSVDRDKKAAKEFAKENQLNYPILHADQKTINLLGDVPGVPTKFILNDKGVVVDSFVGAMSKAELQKRLAKYVEMKVPEEKKDK